jgi:hypothetical protein
VYAKYNTEGRKKAKKKKKKKKRNKDITTFLSKGTCSSGTFERQNLYTTVVVGGALPTANPPKPAQKQVNRGAASSFLNSSPPRQRKPGFSKDAVHSPESKTQG